MLKKMIVVAAILLPVQAFAHPQIVAKDYAGDTALESKLPVDYRKTCGSCHDIDLINMGYHSQMGRLAVVEPEVYDQYRKKGGVNSTLPVSQDELSTPWFSHNPIYGKGGMYGRTAMNHNQKLAPINSSDSLAMTFTTPDQQNGPCGACHPGGGFATEDRQGNLLVKKSKKEIEKSLAAGQYLGDYLRSDLKSGKLKPYTWAKKVNGKKIPNVREIDCLICHGRDYNLAAARKSVGKGLAGWAATVGARLGKINKDKTVSYNDQRLTNLADLIGPATNETCGRCHATAYDIDGDGHMTLADNEAFAATPSLKNSPGLKKRGQAIGNGVQKIGGIAQRVLDTGKTVQYYNANDKTWQPVPYLDVHLEASLTCNDCHAPVYNNAKADKTKHPSHDFAKGSSGYNVRSDLSGTARCENCHNSFLDDHQGSFGPARVTALHMAKIHCTTCHIPRKFVALGESVMKDRGNLGKPDSFKNVLELEGFGKVSIPTPLDYVYYPDRNPETGNYDLKIKAANVMSQMYWATSDNIPLGDRVQAIVFRKAPNTFSLDGDNPGPATMFRLAYFKDGKAVHLKNSVAITTNALTVYAKTEPITIPAQIATARNIPINAPIIGRKTKKGIKFDRKNGKTGWVVMKAGNNQIINPQSGKTMIVRADGTEFTIIDKADEITFAAQALNAAIVKLTNKVQKVKYVYHQTTYDGAFIVSHNVAPVSGFANNPLNVMQCADCHNKNGVFNRSTKIGVHIDAVPGITQFEMPLAALKGNSAPFTEADLRAATFAYYGNTMTSIIPTDGRVMVKAAWNRIDGYSASPLMEELFTQKYLSGMEQVVRLRLTAETGSIRIWTGNNTANNLQVTAWPAGTITNQNKDKNTMVITLKSPGSDVILGISRKAN